MGKKSRFQKKISYSSSIIIADIWKTYEFDHKIQRLRRVQPVYKTIKELAT